MDKKSYACLVIITGCAVLCSLIYAFSTLQSTIELHQLNQNVKSADTRLPNAFENGKSELAELREYWMREYPEAGITREMTDREASERYYDAMSKDVKRRLNEMPK